MRQWSKKRVPFNVRVVTCLMVLVLVGAIALAAVFGLTNVQAGTGSVTQDGDDFYSIYGEWGYSELYGNGIVLSPGNADGSAVWRLTIDPPPPCTYFLEVGVFSSDTSWLGDGADAYVWNVQTSEYVLVMELGTGDGHYSSVSLDPARYASSAGIMYVLIFADWLDCTHIAYVMAVWNYDSTPPTNPNSYVADPPTNTWTNDNTITVTWSGARDDRNFVKGYSIQWSNSWDTLPDKTVDTTMTSTTSPGLADGTWYLHIRAVDTYNNWVAYAFHIGPFYIDTNGPDPPTIWNTPPGVGNDNSPSFMWSIPEDLSGCDGYSYSVDSSPAESVVTSSNEVTLPTLSDGVHTFYVRAVDIVGNWGLPSAFTFTVDTSVPEVTIIAPVDESKLYTSTVVISWEGSDETSGIETYAIQIDGGEWVDMGSLTSYEAVNLNNSYHTVNVRAVDKAGNSVVATVDFRVNTRAFSLGGPNSEVLMILLVLVIVIATSIAAILIRSRKTRRQAHEPSQEKKDS